MTRLRAPLLLPILIISLVAAACRRGEPEPPTTEPASPAATESAADVTYRPAYPEDVSTEDLAEDDVAQQRTGHSHGGEEHARGDGGHTHDREDHGHDDRGHTHDGEDHGHGR